MISTVLYCRFYKIFVSPMLHKKRTANRCPFFCAASCAYPRRFAAAPEGATGGAPQTPALSVFPLFSAPAPLSLPSRFHFAKLAHIDSRLEAFRGHLTCAKGRFRPVAHRDHWHSAQDGHFRAALWRAVGQKWRKYPALLAQVRFLG